MRIISMINAKKKFGLFKNQKIITKLLMLHVLVIAIPIFFLSIYTFNQLQIANEEQLTQNLNYYIEGSVRDINSKMFSMIDLANLAIGKSGLQNYLIDEKELLASELMFFKSYYAENIEQLVYANPDIQSLRIFLENAEILEMWPVIYSKNRLKDNIWIEPTLAKDGGLFWDFFVEETLISELLYDDRRLRTQVVSLYREMKYGSVHLGFLEISMNVNQFFSDMYAENELNGEGFTLVRKNDGSIFSNPNNTFMVKNDIEIDSLSEYLYRNTLGDKGYFNLNISGENLLFSYKYIEALDITLYTAISMGLYNDKYIEQRNIFIGMGVLLIAVLSVLTYVVVAMLLKRINKVISVMREVQEGAMHVDIDIDGADEAAELALHMKKMLTRINELVALVLKKQEVTKDAEIKALQTQINAHFIYNTLETIKMMAEIENHIMISDAITSLGRLMRYSMSWSSASVNLYEEIDYVKNYVKLLNIRRENNIILSLNIQEPLYRYQILKMSVQPIIENAVRYGIEPCETDAVIKIKGFIKREKVIIEISDNGIGMDEEQLKRIQDNTDGKTDNATRRSGIGLRNINERIQLFYGKEYGIKIFSKKDCFTKVYMVLPANLNLDGGGMGDDFISR